MFNYDWDWSVVWRYRLALLKGVSLTMQLTLASIAAGTILGFLFGATLATKDERWREVQKVLVILIDAVRALPILILILLFNYWLPYIVGVRSPFWLACIALSLNLSAFIADVLRGAIEGVPRPLVEAGFAVGMDSSTVMRRIVIPEATRQIVPTVSLLYIDILKLSSLASVIAVGELVHASTEVSTRTFRFLEVYAALAVLYMIIVLPFAIVSRKIERSPWFLRRT